MGNVRCTVKKIWHLGHGKSSVNTEEGGFMDQPCHQAQGEGGPWKCLTNTTKRAPPRARRRGRRGPNHSEGEGGQAEFEVSPNWMTTDAGACLWWQLRSWLKWKSKCAWKMGWVSCAELRKECKKNPATTGRNVNSDVVYQNGRCVNVEFKFIQCRLMATVLALDAS